MIGTKKRDRSRFPGSATVSARAGIVGCVVGMWGVAVPAEFEAGGDLLVARRTVPLAVETDGRRLSRGGKGE